MAVPVKGCGATVCPSCRSSPPPQLLPRLHLLHDLQRTSAEIPVCTGRRVALLSAPTTNTEGCRPRTRGVPRDHRHRRPLRSGDGYLDEHAGPDAPQGLRAGCGEGPAAGVRRGVMQHAAGELLPRVGGVVMTLTGLDARELRLFHRRRDLHRVRDEGGDGGPRSLQGPHRSRAGRDDPVRGGGDEGVVALGAGDVSAALACWTAAWAATSSAVKGFWRRASWASAPRTWAWAAAWLFAATWASDPLRWSAWRRSGPPPRRPGPGRPGPGRRLRLGLGGGRFLGLLHVVGAGAGRLGLLGLGLLDPLLRLLQVEGDPSGGTPAAAAPAPR